MCFYTYISCESEFLILPVTLHKENLLGFQLQLEKSSQEVRPEIARLNALLGVKDAEIVRSLRWTFLEVSHEQVDPGNICCIMYNICNEIRFNKPFNQLYYPAD